MENKITLEDLERRIAALERAVAFARIGGIERHPARSFEGSQSVDMSEAYGSTGKRVG